MEKKKILFNLFLSSPDQLKIPVCRVCKGLCSYTSLPHNNQSHLVAWWSTDVSVLSHSLQLMRGRLHYCVRNHYSVIGSEMIAVLKTYEVSLLLPPPPFYCYVRIVPISLSSIKDFHQYVHSLRTP